MSAQPSQESADLTSGSSGPVCASCGRQKSMSGAGVCCGGIGPTQTSMRTFATFQERFYTRGEGPPPAHLPNLTKANASGDSKPLIFSAADSRARTCPSPASEPDSQASGQDSSLSSPESQMSFDQIGSSLKTSLGSSPLPTDETWESFSQRWPKSGMAFPGGWSTLDSLESPSDAVECSLSDVLEMTVSERYALSARAAKGILRRASARGKTLPVELEQALLQVAESLPKTPPSA